MSRLHREAGFTLVEVMVALLIFGLIALAGISILSFSIRAQAATGTKLDDIGALNRTMSLMSADFAQATDRPTRDESGATRPAFVGDEGSAVMPMVTLVRGGWSNIDDSARSDEQKVAYRVADHTLERITWPLLDGAAPLPPAAMLPHVRLVMLRYRFGGAWSDRWDGTAGAALPQAVELRIERDDGTRYRALFLVGSGYVPASAGGANAT